MWFGTCRPVAGFANICVNRALNDGIENLRSILFHEMTHALVSLCACVLPVSIVGTTPLQRVLSCAIPSSVCPKLYNSFFSVSQAVQFL